MSDEIADPLITPALLLISRRTNNLQAKRVGRLGDPLGDAIDGRYRKEKGRGKN